MFKVGQKVVCVEVGQLRVGFVGLAPKKNDLYTIQRIEEVKGAVYLVFIELNEEEGFFSGCFRPLDYDFVEKVIAMVNERPVVLS